MSTPNMNLELPTVSVTSGPEWAEELNAAFDLVDAHDHTSGKGARIPSGGINLDADLPFNSHNALSMKSVRFTSQGSPLSGGLDLSCVYVSGGNLYFNDSAGNQVRITVGGAVDVSAAGSISGMGATTASVSYNNTTKVFSFLQNTGVPAKLNTGSIKISPDASTANSITLTAAAGLGADYTLTLPAALPASTKIVTVDSSGNLAFTDAVDGASLEVSGGSLRIKDNGVTAAKIAAGQITQVKMGAVGQQVSSSCGNFLSSSSSYVDVTNLSVTITTTGRPVMLMLIGDGTSNVADVGAAESIGPGGSTFVAKFKILRDSTIVSVNEIFVGMTGHPSGSFTAQINVPPGSINTIDFPAAGTYTYKLQALISGGDSVYVENSKLVAFEL